MCIDMCMCAYVYVCMYMYTYNLRMINIKKWMIIVKLQWGLSKNSLKPIMKVP